jgi:hypothetical protein
MSRQVAFDTHHLLSWALSSIEIVDNNEYLEEYHMNAIINDEERIAAGYIS